METPTLTLQYDAVVYDGPGASDVLRLVGSPSRLQWYLQRGRSALQRMEVGRVALPLLMDVLASMLEQVRRASSGKKDMWVWANLRLGLGFGLPGFGLGLGLGLPGLGLGLPGLGLGSGLGLGLGLRLGLGLGLGWNPTC